MSARVMDCEESAVRKPRPLAGIIVDWQMKVLTALAPSPLSLWESSMDRSVTLSVHSANWPLKRNQQYDRIRTDKLFSLEKAVLSALSSLYTCPPHRLMLKWWKYLVPLEVKLGPFISDPTEPSRLKSNVRVTLPSVWVK